MTSVDVVATSFDEQPLPTSVTSGDVVATSFDEQPLPTSVKSEDVDASSFDEQPLPTSQSQLNAFDEAPLPITKNIDVNANSFDEQPLPTSLSQSVQPEMMNQFDEAPLPTTKNEDIVATGFDKHLLPTSQPQVNAFDEAPLPIMKNEGDVVNSFDEQPMPTSVVSDNVVAHSFDEQPLPTSRSQSVHPEMVNAFDEAPLPTTKNKDVDANSFDEQPLPTSVTSGDVVATSFDNVVAHSFDEQPLPTLQSQSVQPEMVNAFDEAPLSTTKNIDTNANSFDEQPLPTSQSQVNAFDEAPLPTTKNKDVDASSFDEQPLPTSRTQVNAFDEAPLPTTKNEGVVATILDEQPFPSLGTHHKNDFEGELDDQPLPGFGSKGVVACSNSFDELHLPSAVKNELVGNSLDEHMLPTSLCQTQAHVDGVDIKDDDESMPDNLSGIFTDVDSDDDSCLPTPSRESQLSMTTSNHDTSTSLQVFDEALLEGKSTFLKTSSEKHSVPEKTMDSTGLEPEISAVNTVDVDIIGKTIISLDVDSDAETIEEDREREKTCENIGPVGSDTDIFLQMLEVAIANCDNTLLDLRSDNISSHDEVQLLSGCDDDFSAIDSELMRMLIAAQQQQSLGTTRQFIQLPSLGKMTKGDDELIKLLRNTIIGMSDVSLNMLDSSFGLQTFDASDVEMMSHSRLLSKSSPRGKASI